MRRRITAIISALALLVTLALGTGVSVVTADSDTRVTDWFADAGYGVMVHFLNRSQNTASAPMSGGASTSWDNCVNEFDVESFVEQVEETGAGYVLFTLQQIDRYFCAPNAAYEALIEQSGVDAADACSTRDLPMELADALAAKGIKLMLYVTADGPWSDEAVFENVLGGEINDGSKQPVIVADSEDATTVNFKNNWLAIIEEYAARYGEKVAGWWIDGADTGKYSVAELNAFGKMLKKHNPNAIVSFNQGGDTREPGYGGGAEVVDADDYTAGEHHAFDAYPTEQYVEGKQWHLLSYLWGGTERGFVEYTADEIIDYVSAVMDKKGVVTLDISVGRTGDIVSAEMDILKKLSLAIRGEKPTYAYEIIQDFSDGSTYTRNSKWSRGVLTDVKSSVTGATDGAATIFQMDPTQVANGENMVNGTAAMALRMNSAGCGWGASHLMNGTMPEATIDNMSGIFFRFKTNTGTTTALSVTTVGAGTVATGSTTATSDPSCGNRVANYLTDADKNAANTAGNAGALLDAYSITKNSNNIRYYDNSGSLIATGRAVPAGFDGWIFIEVDNWDSYIKDGLTINWIDSDYDYVKNYVPSVYGTDGKSNKWCLSDKYTTAVIDDLGYYSVTTADVDNDYQSIIDDIVNPKASPYYDYQIIQNFNDSSTYTRNSMWSRGVLTGTKSSVTGATDGAATIYQMSAEQVENGENMLNGTAALAMRMNSGGCGWGASHLFNSTLPEVKMDNMSGVFFRMKTNTTHRTALSVTTVGADTVATGSATATSNYGGVSRTANYLTDADKNAVGTAGNGGALLDAYSITKNSDNIRYYNTSGELVTTGRVVPAGFDGWIFIEVADWASYNKDGLTINWIDADYDYVTTHASSIAHANTTACDDGCTCTGNNRYKWCRNDDKDEKYTSVVIDDVGYYAVGSADMDDNYRSIIDDIVNPKVSSYYDYQIIQNFNDGTTYTRNSKWSRGMLNSDRVVSGTLDNGATYMWGMDEAQVAAGLHQPNGNSAMALRMETGQGWGSSHLLNSTLPEVKMDNMSGIFFRMWTDVPTDVALSISTIGAGTTASGTSNNNGQALDAADYDSNKTGGNAGSMSGKYALTKNSSNIRYYNTDGELVSTGRVLPKGFDGWIFIEVDNWDSYTKDGLTINYVDSDYSYVTNYASTIAGSNNKWALSTKVSVAIDDVGYYAVGTANADDNYQSIITAVANRETYSYEIIQDFESEGTYMPNSFWTRGAKGTSNDILAGTGGLAHIYAINNTDNTRYESGDETLNGTKAMAIAMLSAGRGWGASHLINDSLPECTLENMSGIFFRMKTNTTHMTALSITTVGKNTEATGALTEANPNGNLLTNADKNDNNAVGNAGALLDAYSITKNSSGIRYYDTEGNLIGSGLAVPAGFDGYVFVGVKDWASYTKDGLTINWIDSDYKYVKEYLSDYTIAANYAAATDKTVYKWCLNDLEISPDTQTSVVIDNVGYYCVGNATADAEYQAIIEDWDTQYVERLRDKVEISCEARGFNTEDALGAKWLADFNDAIDAAENTKAATQIYADYRAKMATLGNPLRLIVGGRQVRTEDTTLRFILEIDQDFRDYMEATYENVEFGTLLARSDLYTGEMLEVGQTKFSKNSATTVPHESTFTPDNYDAKNSGNTLVYTCVVRNIPAAAQGIAVRARSYLKYKASDGSVIVLYGEEQQATYADTLAKS